MQKLPIVLAVLAALAVGFFIGRAGVSSAPAAGDVETPETPVSNDAAEALYGLDSPRARIGRLEVELQEARQAITALTEERDTLRTRVADAASADDAADPSAPTTAKTKARFTYPETKEALSDFDWINAGKSLAKMSPLIDEMLVSLLEGAPKMQLQGEIGALNRPLVSEALKIMGRDGLTGSSVNGVYTHPAVQVNLIAQALDEAGLPLDDNQATRLGELGQKYLDEDARRMGGYGEDTLRLAKLIDEAALRKRFFADVDSLLTEAQVGALHGQASRGRLRADLFSHALVWSEVTGPLNHRTREDLAQQLAQAVMRRGGLPEDAKAQIEVLSAEWAAGFTDAYLAHEPDDLDRLAIFHVDRVDEAAKHMLGFLKAVVERVPLSDEKRAAVRGEAVVLVPVKAR